MHTSFHIAPHDSHPQKYKNPPHYITPQNLTTIPTDNYPLLHPPTPLHITPTDPFNNLPTHKPTTHTSAQLFTPTPTPAPTPYAQPIHPYTPPQSPHTIPTHPYTTPHTTAINLSPRISLKAMGTPTSRLYWSHYRRRRSSVACTQRRP